MYVGAHGFEMRGSKIYIWFSDLIYGQNLTYQPTEQLTCQRTSHKRVHMYVYGRGIYPIISGFTIGSCLQQQPDMRGHREVTLPKMWLFDTNWPFDSKKRLIYKVWETFNVLYFPEILLCVKMNDNFCHIWFQSYLHFQKSMKNIPINIFPYL